LFISFRRFLKSISSKIVPVSVVIAASTVFTPVVAQQTYAECSSAVVDVDGDGWGYENNRSCTVPSGSGRYPTCSSAATDNGRGWGYENNRSCRIDTTAAAADVQAASTNTNSRYPSCTSAAVNNGNGWGYENNQSCQFNQGVSAVVSSNDSTANSRYPSCTSAARDNGNGWGYENNQSCREFGATCLWGSVRPATNRNSVVAAPPPVAVRANGFQDGTPICLTDASDGNADGFGYENDRSCLVVAGQTATAADPLLNTRWCQPWAEISYDDYVLQNNTWNSGDVYSNRWSQCIELGGSRGNYVAKWDYNWLDSDEGNEFSVKSYPQVYYGRKTGNSQSGTPARLGLPAQVGRIPDFQVHYRYSETGIAERNVAFESFFHTSCEAEEWNKHFEMMVWVGKPAIRTPGTLVTTATIDGKVWDVYTNPALSWGYVAFVEQQSSTQGTLDWNEFVNWSRFQGPRYGVWNVGNTCMGAIEIGTETFWGNGTFSLDEFRVTR